MALLVGVGFSGAGAAEELRGHETGATLTHAAWVGGWGPRWRGGAFVGPRFGFGVYAPLYVPPPVYYAPPPVVVQPGYMPPAQPPAGYAPSYNNAPSGEPGYWYYCGNPEGYYPYVQQCSGEWQTVPATPDTGPR